MTDAVRNLNTPENTYTTKPMPIPIQQYVGPFRKNSIHIKETCKIQPHRTSPIRGKDASNVDNLIFNVPALPTK